MAEEVKDTAMEDYLKRISEAMGVEVDKIIDPELKPKGDETATRETEEQRIASEKKEKEDRDAEVERKRLEDERAAAPQRPVILREIPKVTPQPSADELAKKKQEEADAEYVKSLTLEQQDEIELATFAEMGKIEGMSRTQLIEFYRKTDKWVEEHPDADPDSDEFKEFVKANKPKVSDSTRRKIEREMIVYNAEARALARAEEKFKPVVEELNQMKLAPVMTRVNNDISSKLAAQIDGLEPIDESVSRQILSMKQEEAMRKFQVEAPAVIRTAIAMREWAKICNTGEVDTNNKNHLWLMEFIADEEGKMLALPQDQTLKDGRRFVRMAEYESLRSTNPKLLERVYTFDEEDISSRIARLGLTAYNDGLKKLNENGFERKKVEKKAEIPKDVTPKDGGSGGSPIATGRTASGAGSVVNTNPLTDVPSHLRGIPGFS